MYEHLGDNLKLLCSHYRSIAEVCRKLGINRAQFNRYLGGQSRPTAHNLKRICDFFGVEAYELGLPGEQFAQLIGLRRHDQERSGANDPLLELFQPLRDNASSLLSRYCGYYFEYANCMSVPGQILLSLVHLREDRGSFVFERQERQERSRAGQAPAEEWVGRCRYLGAAVYLVNPWRPDDWMAILVSVMGGLMVAEGALILAMGDRFLGFARTLIGSASKAWAGFSALLGLALIAAAMSRLQ